MTCKYSVMVTHNTLPLWLFWISSQMIYDPWQDLHNIVSTRVNKEYVCKTLFLVTIRVKYIIFLLLDHQFTERFPVHLFILIRYYGPSDRNRQSNHKWCNVRGTVLWFYNLPFKVSELNINPFWFLYWPSISRSSYNFSRFT